MYVKMTVNQIRDFGYSRAEVLNISKQLDGKVKDRAF